MESALLQPALLNLAEDAPWFLHMAAEPVKQIWKLHPDINISTLVLPATDLVRIHKNQLERRRICYNNDLLSNENSSVVNENENSNNSPSSSPPGAVIGGIAGGVLGGLLLLTLIGLFPCIFLRRRRLRLQEKHRQQNLNRALKGASALGPYSQRASGIVSPGMKATGPGGYDRGISGGAITSVGHNYAPVSPPITAMTSGRNSPYTPGAGWSGDGSTSLTPQARGDYYTHAVGVTGPQITAVPNAVSGR